MPTTARTPLDSIRHEYMAALVAHDSPRARAVIDRALAAGADPGALAVEVLASTLRDVGDAWEHGELTAADEHYATGMTEGVMALLAAAMRRPPEGGRLAVVACPPGERHGLGARMVGDFLEAAGWEAIVAGADVPARDLLELVADEQPDLVCISVTMPQHMERTFELLGALETVNPRPVLATGGQAWNGSSRVADALGADLVADDPRELVAAVAERLPPLPED